MNLSISFKVVWALWALETENASIPECVFSADVPTPAFDAIPLILKPLDKEIEIVSSPLAPTCKTTLPFESTRPFPFPAKTFWPAKVVLQEIRVISEQSWSTSAWIAVRSAEVLVPVAAWLANVLIFWSISVVSSKAPSTVFANASPVAAFLLPCFNPSICAVKRFEIWRPAASSLAELMRRPEDNLL